MIRVLLEALVVLGLGVTLGLVVNELDRDGLDLCRDHFPQGHAATPSPVAEAGADPGEPGGAAEPAAPDLDTSVLERLAAKGLVGIGFEQTAADWRDELRALGAILFIDARDDEHYQTGHIPGAWQLDHYRSERFLPEILPLLPGCSRIVVYCNGGECEDSESATLLLQQFGADPGVLRVYAGGMLEWRERGMPVELGDRDSGRIEGSP